MRLRTNCLSEHGNAVLQKLQELHPKEFTTTCYHPITGRILDTLEDLQVMEEQLCSISVSNEPTNEEDEEDE